MFGVSTKYTCASNDAETVRADGQGNRASVQRNGRKADAAAERKRRLRAALMV